ncbi:ATP-binding protein [Myxococcota bacterium]|nr:ATP-binding protein [Myxococcota bacterium]
MRARRARGVRYQVSLAFLACGLSLVSCVAAFVLAERLAGEKVDGARSTHHAAWDLGRATDAVYTRLLVLGAARTEGEEADPFPAADFEALHRELEGGLASGSSSLAMELRLFENEARRWWDSGRAVPPRFLPAPERLPEPTGGPGDEDAGSGGAARPSPREGAVAGEARPAEPTPEEADARFRDMDRAYRSFRYGLGSLTESELEATRGLLGTWLPFVVAPPFLLGLLAVYASLRMRGLISAPVEALTAAAEAITRGQEQVRIPSLDPATEFGVLAEAMRQMREHLARTILDLEERNTRLGTAFDSMADGALLVDGQGRVVILNRHANALLGLVGEARLEPGRPVAAAGLETLSRPMAGGEDSSDCSAPGPRADSPPRAVRVVRRALVGPHGEPRGFVAVLRDVTQEREAEQLKNDFLSVVTHELKTPLTGIEGYTRLVLMGRAGPVSDQQKRFLDVVYRQAQTLRGMIQDLLDISRIAAGRMTYEFRLAPVDPIGRRVVEAQATLAHERGLELSYEGSDPERTVVRCDPPRVEQVLANLVQNACKFTDPGGRISVRCRGEGGAVVVEVEDTGRGIPERDLPRLFDKFYQVERGDTRGAGGVGLGLYICKEIASAHGGRIEVRSQVGRGSTFTLTLPRSAEVPVGGGESRTASGTHRS